MFRIIVGSALIAALVAVGAAPASAEPVAGSVVTVTLLGGGQPLEDGWVTVYRVDEGGLPGLSWDSGPTGAGGVFATRPLEPGEYQFEFDPPQGSPFLYGWWDHVPEQGAARTLTVAPGQSYAIVEELDRGAFVTGTATKTSGGFGGVRVSAHPVADGGAAVGSSASARTAPDGTYRIGPLRPGRYALQFTPPRGWITQWWAGATTSDRAQTVLLRGVETRTRVDVRLSSASATVTGSITGTSRGATRPLTGAWAVLFTLSGQYVTSGATAIGGSYTITDVAPGTYLVQFSPPVASPEQPPFAEEYWTDAPTAATARAVTLIAGRTTSLDANLVARPQVPGSIAELPASVRVGATLRADVTTPTPGVAFAYQWLRDGVPIPGAVGRTLHVTKASVDRRLLVAVTGTAPGYSSKTWYAETVVGAG